MRTLIRGADLVGPSGIRENSDALFEGGMVAHIGPPLSKEVDADHTIDAQGLYLLPGFVDLHLHGGGGADFADGTPDAFLAAMRAHLRHGTTAMMPTLVACDRPEMDAAFAAYRQVAQLRDEALPRLLGMHVEGPFVAPSMAGALDPRHLRLPDAALLADWLARWPELARVTLAPELPGAMQCIALLAAEGRIPSLGHSAADFGHAQDAALAGATMVTHLYSTMSTVRREGGFRIPGLIESGLVLDELAVEVIADGCHVPNPILRLIDRAKPQGKLILVTDAMRAAGQQVEKSTLGSLANGIPVLIEDGVAKLPDRSAFAGSVATADRLLRTMVQGAGVPLHRAAAMLSEYPAGAVGAHSIGRLAVGFRADAVLMDRALRVRQVFVGGAPAL